MRVVQVTPTMFGDEGLFGGGERYPVELSRALARHVSCRLVTFGDVRSRTREATGMEVVVLPRRRLVGGHPAQPVGPGLAGATADADVVHAHQLHSRTSKSALRTATRRLQARVLTDHGLLGTSRRDPTDQIDRFLTVSQYSADRLGAPPDRTQVVFGGADPTRFFPDGSERRDGILFVGRLTPHKGVDRLIEALPTEARLTIAGSEGHDRRPPENGYGNRLRRLAAASPGDITFAGRASEADLPVLMRRSAIVVLPSVETTCYGRRVDIAELLGLVVVEAMASGTPVVASHVGGLAEVVADGETGFLVPPGDVAALRDRLASLLSSPRQREAMGRRGRELACEHFTWDACARRCLRSYEELLA